MDNNALEEKNVYSLKDELQALLFRNILGRDDLSGFKSALPEDDFIRLEQIVKEIENLEEVEQKRLENAERYETIHAHKLYPFRMLRCQSYFIILKKQPDGSYLYGSAFARKKEGYYFSQDYEKIKNETLDEVVSHCRFLSKEDFEKLVLGPLLGIPGEIFSTIPKEERFKVVAHYEKPWTDRMGYREGNETRLGNVDLLTGGGCYFGGQVAESLKKDVDDILAAKTIEETTRALGEFSFFYKRPNETFVLLDEIPPRWHNVNNGKLIDDSKERDFAHWRAELLKKYGFKNVDFSKADKEG